MYNVGFVERLYESIQVSNGKTDNDFDDVYLCSGGLYLCTHCGIYFQQLADGPSLVLLLTCAPSCKLPHTRLKLKCLPQTVALHCLVLSCLALDHLSMQSS